MGQRQLRIYHFKLLEILLYFEIKMIISLRLLFFVRLHTNLSRFVYLQIYGKLLAVTLSHLYCWINKQLKTLYFRSYSTD